MVHYFTVLVQSHCSPQSGFYQHPVAFFYGCHEGKNSAFYKTQHFRTTTFHETHQWFTKYKHILQSTKTFHLISQFRSKTFWKTQQHFTKCVLRNFVVFFIYVSIWMSATIVFKLKSSKNLLCAFWHQIDIVISELIEGRISDLTFKNIKLPLLAAWLYFL